MLKDVLRVLIDEVVCTTPCLEYIARRCKLLPVNIGEQLEIGRKSTELRESVSGIRWLRYPVSVFVVESANLLNYRLSPCSNGDYRPKR